MAWDRYKPRGADHGSGHAKQVKIWKARHQPTDLCARCGRPLGPMCSDLHLDHDDYDKRIYIGYSHGACNLRAAGQLGRAVQKAARTPRAPRSWG